MEITKTHIISWTTLLLLILALPSAYAVFDRQSNKKPQITFSHKLHINEGVECETCHENIAKSSKFQDNNLPEKKTCLECHDESDFSSKSPKIVYDRKIAIATSVGYGIKFSHKKHLSKNSDCTKCHAKISESSKSVDNNLPSMTVCNECHKSEPGKCNYCHSTLGSDKYVPASHNKTLWITWHKNQAKRDDISCSDCHKGDIRLHISQKVSPGPGHDLGGDAKDCSNCHKGDIRPKQHGNNYILTHGVDAKTSSNRCLVCHTRASCRDCHKASDLGSAIHPANWVNIGHSSAAQSNLGSCVSCHDENSCLSCHSSVSPHPKNWRTKLMSRTARQHRNPTVCYKCHEHEELCTKCHGLRGD